METGESITLSVGSTTASIVIDFPFSAEVFDCNVIGEDSIPCFTGISDEDPFKNSCSVLNDEKIGSLSF